MDNNLEPVARDRNFYTVYDWMIDPSGLGLRSCSAEAAVYAKIYSMAHHSAAGCTISHDDLAACLFLSRRTAQRALEKLIGDGLITVTDTFRTVAEARGMRCPHSYHLVQEKINEAIERTAPFSSNRLDFGFQQTAGQQDASICHDTIVENSSFQQTAGQQDASKCRNDASKCRNDASSCHIVATNCRISDTCGNAKRPSPDAIGSTCGNATKPQETSGNGAYIYNYNNNKYNNSNLNFNLHSPNPNGNELDEARGVCRELLATSPKLSKSSFDADLLSAVRAVLDSGTGADEILEAWKAYLGDLIDRNAAGGSEAIIQYGMYPLNWVKRASGLAFWLKAVQSAKGESDTPEKGAAKTAPDGANGSDDGRSAEELVKKFKVRRIDTSDGSTVWTFLDRFHSGAIATGCHTKAEALRFACSEHEIEIPADFHDVEDDSRNEDCHGNDQTERRARVA